MGIADIPSAGRDQLRLFRIQARHRLPSQSRQRPSATVSSASPSQLKKKSLMPRSQVSEVVNFEDVTLRR